MSTSSQPMASSQTHHKKRKHSSVAEASGSATSDPNALKVSVLDSSTSLGPAWVNFSAVRPAKSTPFKVYRRDKASDDSTDITKQQTCIAGETGDVEFFSFNKDMPDAKDEHYACQYLPALYDPATNSLVIHPSAPTYIMTQRVKRLKALPAFTDNSISSFEESRRKRTQLGEAFGTKKAQSRIRAEERNKVNAVAQEKSRDHLMDSIGRAHEKLPMTVSSDQPLISHLIPPPNTTTTDVADVYPLSVLIPQEELASIDVKSFANVDDDRERMNLLPFRSSRWIESKMRVAMSMPLGPKKETLKILYYIACIRQLQRNAKALGNSMIVDKMNGAPRIIIDGLIKRFTETAKGSTKPAITLAMEKKLLAYDMALRLHVENFACDYQAIADDLQITAAKIREVFKSLGCTCETISPADRIRLGMSVEEAKKGKRALLQAPPVFPKPRTGPAKR